MNGEVYSGVTGWKDCMLAYTSMTNYKDRIHGSLSLH